MFSRMGADGYHDPQMPATPRNRGRLDVAHRAARLKGLLIQRFCFRLSVLACLAVLGCSSDESVVCDRLAECDLLPEGLSAADCEDQAATQVPEDRLSDCADCVESKDCEEIQDGCRTQCEPGD
jgi:hypothetical protein